MKWMKRPKLSPALLVSVVALVAALGGGAVAGVTVSALNKKEKKQVTKIAKKQAKKLDKRIALLPGPQGDSGTARAYGHVDGDGSLTNSKNIASVTRPAGGTYCIEPTAGAGIADTLEHPIVATPDYFGDTTSESAGTMAHVEARTDNSHCSSPTGEFEVRTMELDATTGSLSPKDESFNFVIP